ncbi:MAG: DUF4276 family protein [Candidatus Omnitrophota bacterium]
MIIGVGVEGNSDKEFYEKILFRYFPQIIFKVRNYKNKQELISKTPSFWEECLNRNYNGCFILVDSHEQACISEVRMLFNKNIIHECRKSIEERNLFICVVIRGLESWLLADDGAIKNLFPSANYEPPDDTGIIDPKKTLKKIDLKRIYISNKTLLAKQIAAKFNPNRAKLHSPSFAYFWDCLQTKFRLIES